MIRVEVADDWREQPPPTRFAALDASGWLLSLPEEDAARCFAGELSQIPNARLLSIWGTTLAVLALLLPLGLFAILGNGIYDLLLEDAPTPRLYLVVGGSLLAYVVLAAIAAGSRRMSLLSQELGEMVDGFRDMTHRFHLRPARIMRQARAWGRLHGLARTPLVSVWNPGLPSPENSAEVFWDILLPLFEAQLADGSRLRLHVRADEAAAVRAALQGRPRLQLEAPPPRRRGGNAQAPASALAAGERRLVQMLRVASFPLQRIMACPLADAPGPACFSENAFLRLVRSFAGEAEQDGVHRFLARCRNDYGYLEMDADRIELLRLPDDLAAATLADARNLAARARQLLISDPRRFLHDGDPCALLCTVNALAVLHDRADDDPRLQQNLKQQLKTLISETLASLDRGEHYPLFAHLARQEFGAGPEAGQLARLLPRVIDDAGASRPLAGEVLALTRFNAFDTETLGRLARLLEVGGFYAAASAVWGKLASIDPLLAGIRLARLHERQGDAAAGLAAISELLASEHLEQRPGIRVAALLEGAWLCYSAQPPDALDQGRAWLAAAADELARCPGEPEAYWRLHNYRALYLDAAGRYPEAIAEHRQALAIPGIQLKWYSGSLTNLAYVSRKAALAGLGARDEAARRLAEALEYAGLAVDLKRRIADLDELPVALHNLALAHLCRALLDLPGADLDAAADACGEGLAILARTGSHKKRFALCLEATLAAGLRGEDWAAPLAEARAARPSAREQAVLARSEAAADIPAALGRAVLALEILD